MKKPPAKTAGKRNPLRVSDSYRRFVLDQLEELGDVTPRPMFGGVGLYHRGVFFAIVAGDRLYFKVDPATRPDYERLGMGAFNPYPGRGGSLQYFSVPIEVIESSAELATWARRAIAVARRTKAH
jgi:DNA transformation protein